MSANPPLAISTSTFTLFPAAVFVGKILICTGQGSAPSALGGGGEGEGKGTEEAGEEGEAGEERKKAKSNPPQETTTSNAPRKRTIFCLGENWSKLKAKAIFI